MDRFYTPAERAELMQAARLEDQRRIAAQKATLEAERKAIFGDGPPGSGGSAAFSGTSHSQTMPAAERRRLLTLTDAGRRILAQSTPSHVREAALSGRPAPVADPAKDALLSLTETGRWVLKARQERLERERAAGQ